MREFAPEEVLTYDPATGELRWKPRPADWFTKASEAKRWNARYAGQIAGTLDSKGHRQIRLNGRLEMAHRIAWRMSTGEWPKDEIDHEKGNGDDNRLGNLREVSHSRNCRNQKLRNTNTSGTMGVHQTKRGRWVARIGTDAGRKHLGVFDTKEEAVAARRAAERKHEYHQNHGRIE